jgi:ABC-2 type transport system permease protein
VNAARIRREFSVLLMQIRREFWEHRVLLFAPAALSGLFLLMCLLAGTRFATGWFSIGGVESGSGGTLPPEFVGLMHVIFTTVLYLLMAVVAFAYLADCLYSERKDRSILFWKSLPVSDTTTVMAKLLVALVAVPFVVYVFSLAANVLASGIFKATYVIQERPGGRHWTWFHWLRLNGLLFVDIFVLALWFAPVAAYQLLISVWAKRAAFVWTVLPPVALVLGERMFFNSWHIGSFLGYRLGGVMFAPSGAKVEGVEAFMRSVDAIPLLARPDLWFGVALAVPLLYLTIRIRRHSDDT